MGPVCGHRPPGFSFGNFLCLGSVIAPAAKACAYKFNTSALSLKNIRQAMKLESSAQQKYVEVRMRVSQIIGLLRSALSADETRSTEHDSARCLLSWQSSNLAAADSSSLDIWRQPDNLAAAKHENPDSDNVCPKIWNAPFRMGVSRNSGVPLSLFCLPGRPPASRPRSLGEHARISDAPGVKMDFPGWSVPKWG